METKKRKLDEPAAAETAYDNRGTEQSSSVNSTEKRQRQIGPALPPSLLEGHDKSDEQGSENDSDDDDDDFGPSLPPAGAGTPGGDIDGPESHHGPQGLTTEEEESTSKFPEQKHGGGRDTWMLQPPDSSDWSSRVDPTKLRNRKFQTGRSARGSGGPKSIDTTWTETPEQKMNRLQSQVMGASSPSTSENPVNAADQSRASEVMRERIKKYNDETRGKASSTNLRKPVEEDDDPSKRAFDREKDMSLSSRISHADRRKLMDKASDFGSRFTGGKFL
ncbi:hypothetical protein PHISCL_01137 [Aspergillus sclerotialis]|uniref:DUF3752 domain-containing protein n=1 Tax=Aspergillus sclerotialis TaxID=2070753 RepID=A0A3A3A471_9EURO|nr:hypothetical protein PHISCL_01137 [Aspergillus sclerotialis]